MSVIQKERRRVYEGEIYLRKKNHETVTVVGSDSQEIRYTYLGTGKQNILPLREFLKLYVKKEEDMEKKTRDTKKEKVKKKREAIPPDLLKHQEIGEALKGLEALKEKERSSGGAKYRRILRDKGFKLSDPSTWEKFRKKS